MKIRLHKSILHRVQHSIGFAFMENIAKNKNTYFKLLYIWMELNSTKL